MWPPSENNIVVKIGLVALVLGLGMKALLTTSSAIVHFISGFLVGFAIVALLFGRYQQRRIKTQALSRR